MVTLSRLVTIRIKTIAPQLTALAGSLNPTEMRVLIADHGLDFAMFAIELLHPFQEVVNDSGVHVADLQVINVPRDS